MGDLAITIETPPDVTISVPPSPDVTIHLVGAVAAGPGSEYDHSQPVPATVWTINHNLGRRPAVDVFDSGSRQVIAEVLHASTNQTLVMFATPTAGFARLT